MHNLYRHFIAWWVLYSNKFLMSTLTPLIIIHQQLLIQMGSHTCSYKSWSSNWWAFTAKKGAKLTSIRCILIKLWQTWYLPYVNWKTFFYRNIYFCAIFSCNAVFPAFSQKFSIMPVMLKMHPIWAKFDVLYKYCSLHCLDLICGVTNITK